MASECNYKVLDRHLKVQFINGLNDDDMIVETIFELTPISDRSSFTSKQVLALVRRVETQDAHTTIVDTLQKSKEFNTVKSQSQAVKQFHNQKPTEKSATDHHSNKNKSANIADPAIHLNNVQHIERCVGIVES